VRAAGGLGFRRAGDVLSRLVNDVEALDGLYLRILAPLAGDPVQYTPARIWSSSASVVRPAAITRSSSWRTRTAAGSSA